MSNGHPKLRTMPPKAPESDALKRLQALETWTEEPAKAAAESIEPAQMAAGEGAAEASVAQEAKAASTARQASKASSASKASQKVETEAPWGQAGEGVRQLNIRIPDEVFVRLKWLGDTTYGTNMTQLAIQAISEKVEAMLKERGIK